MMTLRAKPVVLTLKNAEEADLSMLFATYDNGALLLRRKGTCFVGEVPAFGFSTSQAVGGPPREGNHTNGDGERVVTDTPIAVLAPL